MAVTPAQYRLAQARTIGWVLVFVFWAIVLPFAFWTPTAWNPRHTYQTSTPPGTLVSDRWDWQFWSIGMYALMWTIPITLAFTIDSPLTFGRRTFHIVLLVLFFFWFVVQMVFGAIYWANANNTKPDFFDNPAHDDRWCCVYYNLPGAPCLNTDPCVPGVGAADLIVNPSFLFRFWYNVLLILFCIVDFFYIWLVLKRSTDTILREANSGQAEGLIRRKMNRV